MTAPTRRRLLAAVPAVAVAAALSGCDFGGLQGTDGKQYISGTGVPVFIKPADRSRPVDVTGTDLDGRPLSLATYRGQVVMLSVWGSWCAPCVKETPSVVALAETFATGKDAGKVQILGVNELESGGTAVASSFARENDMTYPSFYDDSGQVLLGLSDKLGPYSLPSTVVLDQQGRVAVIILGSIPGQVGMQEIVEQVIDGG